MKFRHETQIVWESRKINCITQVSEEIKGRVTTKLSQELSKTESLILDALSQLDEFFGTRTLGLTPDPFRKHLDF